MKTIIILSLIAVGALVYFAWQGNQCSQQGGVYVRTLWGMECLQK